MGKPLVTHIAAARVRTTKGDPLFCQTCTAYIGRMGHGPKGCAGDPIQHAARISPKSLVDHDHEAPARELVLT